MPFLMIAFALLAHALARSDRMWRFGLAGATLSLAALTRSMPVFFVGPRRSLLLLLRSCNRKTAGGELAKR